MKILLEFLFGLVVGYLLLSSNIYQKISGEYRSLEMALANPEQVLTLDLSNQRLQKLPKEIGLFSQLKTLRISYNQLIELPK